MTVKAATAEETVELGRRIGGRLQPGQVLSLQGPLGSGKTTLVKGIAAALDIREAVTSPSFTLIAEYRGSLPLYHMDLYRIDSTEEFEMLGAEEMMYGRGVTVIEWGEKAEALLPQEAVRVRFRMREEGRREIVIEGLSL